MDEQQPAAASFAQYNMLIGTVGELASGQRPYAPGGHALMISDQCVGLPYATVAAAQPAVTGHKFKVEQYELCRDCHSMPELLVEFTDGRGLQPGAGAKRLLEPLGGHEGAGSIMEPVRDAGVGIHRRQAIYLRAVRARCG